MVFWEIDENNLSEYKSCLDQDAAENIERTYYHGLAFGEDEHSSPKACLIWFYLYLEEADKDSEARLDYFYAEDKESGESILKEFEGRILEEGVTECRFELPKESIKGMEDVFKDYGYTLEEREGTQIIVSVEQLAGLDIVKKKNVPDYIKDLGSLMVRPFRRGIMNCIFHTRRELPEDLPMLSYSWFDPELSSYAEADGRVNGFLLVHKTSSGKLQVFLLSAFGPDAQKELLHMVRFSIIRTLELYPETTQILFRRRDEASKKLSDYFFPESKGENSVYGSKQF